MSCGFPAHSLPFGSYLIPSSLQFPPERLSCRWCLSNNQHCRSRATSDLLGMCGSCNASPRRDPGPEEEPTADLEWLSEGSRLRPHHWHR